MKNKLFKQTISLIVAMLILSISIPVFAESTDTQRIFDDANLMTEEEIVELQKQIETIQDEYKIDVMVVTTSEYGEYDIQDFANDFNNTNGKYDDGIVFVVNMKSRDYAFSTRGDAIRIFTDKRFDEMEDKVKSGLRANVVYGINDFLSQTEKWCKTGIPDNQYNYNTETGDISKYRNLKVKDIIIFAVISLVIALVVCLIVIGRYKLKFSTYNYPLHDRGGVQLSNSQDIYLREHTTSYKIQTNSSSGGGGSGRSSYRGSNGGRSGKF